MNPKHRVAAPTRTSTITTTVPKLTMAATRIRLRPLGNGAPRGLGRITLASTGAGIRQRIRARSGSALKG